MFILYYKTSGLVTNHWDNRTAIYLWCTQRYWLLSATITTWLQIYIFMV